MKNAMFVGLAIGMVAGACIASNSKKTRSMVTNAQEQIMSKVCPQKNEWQNDGDSQGESSTF